MTTVASFQITHAQFLGPDGQPTGAALPPAAADPGTLIAVYRLMVLTRTFDAKAITLQRTGQIGTYPSNLGQEAIGAVAGILMHPEDVLVPTYREQAAQIARGVTLEELLAFWGGDERGSDFRGPREDFPVCVPIGTQACHAVGVASAFKLRAQRRVAVCMMGDGATSKGEVYESMNLAGAWRLPVVFVVANNQWAISMPRSAQTAARTIAQKAIAAGFDGEQVDGNDPVALHWALGRALDKARAGGGPTLVEALTYRLGDHTTADDASRYRDQAEVEAHRAADPVTRTRAYLERVGAWTDADEAALAARCASEVDAAVAAYRARTPEPPEAMFDSLFAVLPRALAAQREAARREGPADA